MCARISICSSTSARAKTKRPKPTANSTTSISRSPTFRREFYLETVQNVFQEFHLPRGIFKYRGQRVEPAAIQQDGAAHRRGRARRHLFRRSDRGRARSVHIDQAVPQEALRAARGWSLRRVLGHALADADLSDRAQHDPGEFLTTTRRRSDCRCRHRPTR